MKIMKKCPPGVFCIENMTLAFVVIALFLILYFIYNIIKVPVSTNNNIKLDLILFFRMKTSFLSFFSILSNLESLPGLFTKSI